MTDVDPFSRHLRPYRAVTNREVRRKGIDMGFDPASMPPDDDQPFDIAQPLPVEDYPSLFTDLPASYWLTLAGAMVVLAVVSFAVFHEVFRIIL